MMEEIDFMEEETSNQNNSFDDNYNNQPDSDLFLLSKDNLRKGSQYFETEFKKVFNYKDTFVQNRREEEKDIETEKNEETRKNKKRIFKLINVNKYVNKKSNLKRKKIFRIFGKNDFKNYSFDELIIYINKLNNSSKTSATISNKYKLLKLEHKLILELKTRILDQIKENGSI